VDTLFSLVSIGPVPLHHRVVMAPLTRSRSKQPGDVPGWAFRFCRTKFARFGIRASPEFDLSIMMRQKQASVKALGRSIEDHFDKNGVDRIEGWARLTGRGQISVCKADQTKVALSTRHVVIATGSIPSSLPGVVVDQNRIVDSTGALALHRPPRRLLIIGGGSIGLELGSVWQRLGTDVEVVEAPTKRFRSRFRGSWKSRISASTSLPWPRTLSLARTR
jgi:pyruvate/2-oxoglutarate dehydrogenase complex dihydrolipoamide dehydrogenase (E3) component